LNFAKCAIKKMSIRNKLILLVLLVLIPFLYFVQEHVRRIIFQKQNYESLYKRVLIADKISILSHSLQNERTFSNDYLFFKDKSAKEELEFHKEKTNNAIQNLEKVYIETETSSDISVLILRLNDMRSRINALQPSIIETRQFYINLVNILSEEHENIIKITFDPEIKDILYGHFFYAKSKDRFEEIRARLRNALMNDTLTRNDYAALSGLQMLYDLELSKFKSFTDQSLLNYFNQKYKGDSINIPLAVLNQTITEEDVAKIPYDPEEWFNIASGFLSILKEIEDYSTSKIRETTLQRLTTSKIKLRTYLTITVVILLLSIFASWYIIKGITSSISSLKRVANSLAQGDLDVELDVKTKDEIGDLANSFKALIENANEFSKVATEIGKGDYNVKVNIRSSRDILGNALTQMRNNLLKLSEENSKRTWLLTGNTQLNENIRGEKSIPELAKNIINHLADYLKFQVGAIYLMEEDKHLKLVSSYAFDKRKINANSVMIGEGLVGQAAQEKKKILFDNVPDDYIRINSGLGETEPKYILVWPFLYEDEVKGIIEMGSVEPFEEMQYEYLQLISENISIAINSSVARDQLKGLLDQTQEQTEELESQQEELKQTNEELTEQKNRLQVSEEELRVQQEELKIKNNEMELKTHQLEQQNKDIIAKNQELEDIREVLSIKAEELAITSKYKSEFLANMSHELRTPLNSILILTKMLMENKKGNLTDKQVESARVINKSGNDLLTLINDILDLSKVESGKISLELSDFTFNEIQDDLKATFDEVAEQRKIAFTINKDQKLRESIYSDKLRLLQILRNLLSNAFKFTDKGGNVELSIYPAPSNTYFKSEELKKSKNVIAFSIKDTGIGIPENKQKVIFEAFQQADATTSRKYGGTGLGLTISREIAHILGGEIQLKSAEGKGSTFIVYLPEKLNQKSKREEVKLKTEQKEGPATDIVASLSPEIQKAQVTDDRKNITANDKVILIIEDNREFAAILKDIANEKGFKTIIAHQGDIGFENAKKYKPDGIILDIRLPVMNGWTVLKNLKTNNSLKKIPVHIITVVDDKEKCIQMGANGYLKKPASTREIEAAMDNIESFVKKKIKKVLIIEDNKIENDSIKELLTNSNINSISAFTGKEALKIIETEKLDCVILDLKLPDMSGFEILEKIKNTPKLTSIPFVIYTSADLTKEQEDTLNKLSDAIVLKTASSAKRLLDEVNLFIHKIKSDIPENQRIIKKPHITKEALKGKKVLVVDDDMRNVYSLLSLLEEQEMEVITANDGIEAIQKLNDNPEVDIVLMDIMMPNMDGYEAMKKIREDNRFINLPIIALTAKAMKGDREKCINAGASDYISKPVDSDKLFSLMRIWLYK